MSNGTHRPESGRRGAHSHRPSKAQGKKRALPLRTPMESLEERRMMSAAKINVAIGASTPFSGTALALPAKIEAENFDNGGEGVAFHDTSTGNTGGQYRSTSVDVESTSDAGGGFDVGWIDAGEWLNYTVNVTNPGTYTFSYRVATNGGGGSFHMELDGNGNNVTGALNIPNTNSWQTFTTVNSGNVTLPAGVHVLSLVFDSFGSAPSFGNVNWFQANFVPPAIPPAAPSGLTVGAVTTNSVALSWTNAAGSTQTSVRVERKTGANGTYAPLPAAANLAAATTSFTDATTAPGVTYFYRVIANNGLDSAASNEVSTTTLVPVPPPAPSELAQGTVTNNSVALTWTNGASTNQTSVRVERKTGAAGNYATLPAAVNLAAGATSFADATAAANTTYVYRIIASSGVDSPASNELSVTTAPNAPTALSAIVASATSVNLAWAAPASGTTTYRLERKLGAGGTYAPVSGATALAATTLAFADIGLTTGSTYVYRIVANNGADSPFSGEVSAPLIAPAQPLGVLATAISNTQINVTWTALASNQTGFRLERKTSVNGTYAPVTGATNLAANAISFSNIGLSAGAQYYYRLFATNLIGDSVASVEVNATTVTPPTSTPFGGTATPVPGTIQGENFDNGGEGLAFHKVSVPPVSPATRGTTVFTEGTTDTGGGYDIGYINPGDWLAYTVNATAGTYTFGYRVACLGDGGFFHMEVDGVNVTGSLKIPNTQNWQSYVTVTKAGIVVTGGTHVLKIVFDAGGSGGAVGNLNWFQGTLTTPAAPPTGLTLGPVTVNSVALSWTNVAGSTQSSVRVERKTGVNGTYATLAAGANLSATATTFTDTTAAAGTQYFYHVIASNGQDSPASNEITATTIAAPIAPSGLTLGTVTINSVALTWTNDPTSTQTSVRVERKTGANGTYATLPAAATLAATATSFTDNTAAPGVTYFYHVVASNGVDSPASNEVTTTTPTPPPPAVPTGVTIGAITSTSVALSWTNGAGTNQTSVRVERRTNPAGAYTIVSGLLAAGATSFTDTSASPGTSYYYHVVASNGADAATADVQAFTSPSAPTSLAAVATSATAVNLTWALPASGTQTSFRLERKLGVNGTYSPVSGATALAANATSFPDSGLTAGSTYFYRITANNGTDSPASVEASVALTVPGQPFGFVATAISNTQINVSWSALASNQTGFRLERKTGVNGAYATVTGATNLAANAISFSNIGLSAGAQYYYRLFATNLIGDSVASVEVNATTVTPPTSTPFGGTATPIPGTIQGENFDNGGEGLAFHKVSIPPVSPATRGTTSSPKARRIPASGTTSATSIPATGSHIPLTPPRVRTRSAIASPVSAMVGSSIWKSTA